MKTGDKARCREVETYYNYATIVARLRKTYNEKDADRIIAFWHSGVNLADAIQAVVYGS